MIKLNNNPILLCLLSALLMSVGWPPLPLFFLLFVGLIPVLQLSDLFLEQKVKTYKFWLYILVFLVIWNIATTWWVWFASEGGAIAMVIGNTLLMSVPFVAYYITRRAFPKTGYSSLVIYWLAFENTHFIWEITFPWLTFGHGLSMFPELIQWISYTGVLGASLWIWIVNIGIHHLLKQRPIANMQWGIVKVAVFQIGLPALFSVFLFFKNQPKADEPKIEVIVFQPNYDPYDEKFRLQAIDIANEMVEDARKLITPETRLLVWPETAIPYSFDMEEWKEFEKITVINAFVDSFPFLSVLTGTETHEFYESEEKPTATARYTGDTGWYYDVYNTAMFFSDNKGPEWYHKTKLVPGVEHMPYPKYLAFLEPLAIKLEGTFGSLGSSKEPIVFVSSDSIVKVAPLICYESVYGDFTREFILKDANLLAIITNDGWWGNTPGYRQHLYYGSLRAIETNRWIVRSANTGISAIIHPTGRIAHKTEWWVKSSIKSEVALKTGETFFVKHGNLLGVGVSMISVLMILSALVKNRLGSRY
jgi:apolipoprotein N-acyltransferase